MIIIIIYRDKGKMRQMSAKGSKNCDVLWTVISNEQGAAGAASRRVAVLGRLSGQRMLRHSELSIFLPYRRAVRARAGARGECGRADGDSAALS